MKSKELCSILMEQIEEFKTNEEFNEHVYMSLVNGLQKIYDQIELTEYCTIYYTKSDIHHGDNEVSVESNVFVKTLRITNMEYFLGMDTKRIPSILNGGGLAVHRDKIAKIREDLESPEKKFVYHIFVDESETITIYKMTEH